MTNPSLQTHYRLPRATPMGKLLGQLDQTLRNYRFCANLNDNQLRAKLINSPDTESLSDEHRYFMADIYPQLHSFFIGKPPYNLGKIELYQGDIHYLMGDPIGNILRRPFVAAYMAAAARIQVPCPSGAEGARDLLLDSVVKVGFSKFYGVGSEKLAELIDSRTPNISAHFEPEQVIESFKQQAQQSPQAVFSYVEQLDGWAAPYMSSLTAREGGVFERIQEERENARRTGASLPPSPFFADPGHVFNAWETIRIFREEGNLHLNSLIAAKKLSCDISVMVVEDNMFFAWAINRYKKCPQMQPFVPSDAWIAERVAMESRNESFRVETNLRNGWFKSAEDALSCLENALKQGKVPDVIFADIELGSGMNGLEFAKQAHKMCLEAGKEIRIMFVTSSNLTLYREEVRTLQDSGVITGSRRKSDFYLPDVIDQLSELLSKGN